ncbi:hypothetical protein H6G93_35435 [Nostoc sp. FACHB-973]|nr:hypothetical protein [Nostoc sp. FACHB-973]
MLESAAINHKEQQRAKDAAEKGALRHADYIGSAKGRNNNLLVAHTLNTP